MKLIYFQKAPNFGDALNPLIFQKFFPDFFNENEDQVLIGIGSILHLKFPEHTKKIVFSTGYAYYGDLPNTQKNYHFACVRGPLTSRTLGLDSNLAVTDGAALLREFEFPKVDKKHEFSFMPHHASLFFNDWERICEEVGYNYINPLSDHKKILAQIMESKVVIAEAMHGAIVADTLRVPWIPLKLYPTINEFKWQDWTQSMSLQYKPNILPSIYSKDMVLKKVAAKLQNTERNFFVKSISKIYQSYQTQFVNKDAIKQFSNLKYKKTYLSKENLLDLKVEQLLNKVEDIRTAYCPLQNH